MFDTEKFIMEIQSRDSIWNTSSTEYADRSNRRKAWEEVCAIMFEGFNKFSAKKKNELLQELQKKWKHLRDYFVREKNKELQQKVVVPKKRRAPFLDLLNEFMHVSKTPGSPGRPPPAPHQRSPNSIEESDESNCKHSEKEKPTLKPVHEAHTRTSNQNQSNLDPNMVFLLSILPEMQTMDQRQAFEFKLEVMKLIKKIKYNDLNNIYDSPAGTSNGYHHPYYVLGNQNYGDPQRGINSPTSDHSEEDQSFLPPEICLIEKEVQVKSRRSSQEDVSGDSERVIL